MRLLKENTFLIKLVNALLRYFMWQKVVEQRVAISFPENFNCI